MDITQIVYGFNRQDTFCHIKPRHILREYVVLHQHGHQIASGQELHDQVEIKRILERIEQLHDPRRGGFGENVAFGSDVGELFPSIHPIYSPVVSL